MILKNFLGRSCGEKNNRCEQADRRCRKGVFLIGALSLLIVLLFALGGCDSDPTMSFDDLYNDAISLMENGKYDEAMTAFDALDGYKDSDEQIKACRDAIKEIDYNRAIDLMDSGELEEAIEIFEKLEGYKFSATYAVNCKSAVSENEYARAIELMDSYNYSEAEAIFVKLGNYRSSLELLKECQYYLSFTFVLNSPGNGYTVTDYNGNGEEIVIPSEYAGMPVVRIGYGAFERSWSALEITVPETVTDIGDYAFSECSNLESVALPQGLLSLGDKAFYKCEKLSGVALPRSMKNLGKYVFTGCRVLGSIKFIGSEEEWSLVSKEKTWAIVGDSDDIFSVIFAPECDGVNHYTVIDAAVAPTCTETGLSEGTHCDVCKTVIVAQKNVDALGHDITEHDSRTPTCEEVGWNAYETCSRCSYSTYAEINELGHDIKKYEAKSATCTEIGWEVYEACSRCNYSTYVEIGALTHDISEYAAQDPTCEAIGWEAYEACSRCDYSTYAEIDALTHDISEYAAQAPTCEAIGWEVYEVCSRCDYSTYVEIEALTHDISEYAAKDPTCAAIGWEAYEACSRCDYSTLVEIPMLEHTTISHEAKEPTCTEVGWNTYETCSECDYSTYVEIKALGHDKVKHDSQKVTCINIGWKAYETCSRCSYSTYVEIPIDDDAHDFDRENTCTLCHKYLDDGVVFTLSDDEAYYTVTDYTGDAERVVIPSQYKGVDVTSIGGSAFADCTTVKTIVITENITSIGENAFSGCSSLDSLKYTGSEEQWADIEAIDETLASVEIVFEYDFDDVIFHFIDVGQGDAILVTTPWGNMLIDSGDDNNTSRNKLMNYLASQNITSFEYVVFTHPDADHIGSADRILLNYNVKNVIMPDYEKTTQVYNRLLDAIESTGVNLILIGEDEDVCEQPGYTFSIGALVNTVMGPVQDYKDANEMSVVIKSVFGDISVLFTGDAEKGSEADMLALYKNGELDCDILKVGHHGSDTSTTAAFLAAVSPDMAVISCGAGNKYGHPHSQIIQRLENAGVDYFRTDTDGDVVIKTNGEKIEVVQ